MVRFTLLEVNLAAGSIPSLGVGDDDGSHALDSATTAPAPDESSTDRFGPDPKVLLVGGLAFVVAVVAVAWRVLGSDVGTEAIDDAVPAPLADDADAESLDDEI